MWIVRRRDAAAPTLLSILADKHDNFMIFRPIAFRNTHTKHRLQYGLGAARRKTCHNLCFHLLKDLVGGEVGGVDNHGIVSRL